MNNQKKLKDCQEAERLLQKAICKIYPFSKIKLCDDMNPYFTMIDIRIFYKNKDFIIRKKVDLNVLDDKNFLMFLAKNSISEITEEIMRADDELEAKETPKKPHLEGDSYSDGELVYDTWICPNCEESYEVDYDKYDYCPKCGQKIDWSEYEDEWGVVIKR